MSSKQLGLAGQTRDLVENGLDKGREFVRQALGVGQRAAGEYLRPSPPPRTGGSWGWLAVGAVGGAVAVLLGRQATAAMPGSGRRVEEVMVRDVETIDASATLTQAAQRMRDANVGVLPVVENGRVRAVVTDRDVVVRGVARGIDTSQLRVLDVATRDLVAARPDWPVERALETMAAHQIGRLPVVDDAEKVIGIVTLSSLALRAHRPASALDTAQEVSRRSARAV
jgi:CBS domain-containing protein